MFCWTNFCILFILAEWDRLSAEKSVAYFNILPEFFSNCLNVYTFACFWEFLMCMDHLHMLCLMHVIMRWPLTHFYVTVVSSLHSVSLVSRS